MLRDLSKLIDEEDSEGGDGDRLQKELRLQAARPREDRGSGRRNFTLFLRPALPIVVSKDTLGSLEEFVSRSTAYGLRQELRSRRSASAGR